jgi:hypothetical protein
MEPISVLLIMGIGLTLLGIFMLLRPAQRSKNVVKGFGIELELSTPSLVVLVLGVFLTVLYAINPHDSDSSIKESGSNPKTDTSVEQNSNQGTGVTARKSAKNQNNTPQEFQSYTRAISKKSRQGYEDFLNMFPSSQYAVSIREKLDSCFIEDEKLELSKSITATLDISKEYLSYNGSYSEYLNAVNGKAGDEICKIEGFQKGTASCSPDTRPRKQESNSSGDQVQITGSGPHRGYKDGELFYGSLVCSIDCFRKSKVRVPTQYCRT